MTLFFFFVSPRFGIWSGSASRVGAYILGSHGLLKEVVVVGGSGQTEDLTFYVLGFSGLFIMYTDRLRLVMEISMVLFLSLCKTILEGFPVDFLMGLCLGRWRVVERG